MKIFAAAILLLPGLLLAENTNFPSGTFAVTNVRLFDGERTSQNQTVLVRDGKIAAVGEKTDVPAGTPTVDGTGRTLLPGLIDAHVHAYPENALRQAEALGVTTVLDMFASPDLVKHDKEIEGSGAGLDGADIFSAGICATAPGGHGTEYGFDIPTLSKPDEAQSFVDARIAEGSDYIKVILEDGKVIGHPIPTLDRATAAALVSAAHQRHKMAVFHIGSYEEAREAVEIGADGLMHLFLGQAPEPDFGGFVAKHHTFVAPTLSVLLSVTGTNTEGKSLAADKRISEFVAPEDLANLKHGFPVNAPLNFDVTTETIHQLKSAHVDILAGTDAPNPGTTFGASLHGELELLVAAGLTPEEALRGATSKPAAHFALNDRGQVAVGKRADLLLVTGDPTSNITDTRNIVAVWKSGHACDRAAYAAQVAKEKKARKAAARPLATGNGTISNFEDGTDHTAFGAGWSKSTDALFGGNSTVDYEIVAEGANGTKKSMRVNGEIVGGVPYTWAGPMFSPGGQPFAPVNLTKRSGLQFWARGDGKTYRIMYFTASGGNIPQMTTFVAGADWKHYNVPFSTFGDSDGHDVAAILFSGGPEVGKFSFQLDEVGLVPKP